MKQTKKNKKKLLVRIVPWNGWFGVLFIVIAWLLATLLAAIVILVYSNIDHIKLSTFSSSDVGNFLTTLILYALLFFGIYIFLHKYKTNFKIIGLGKIRKLDIPYGLLAALVFYGVYNLADWLFKKAIPTFNVNQKQNLGFTNPHGLTEYIILFLSIVVLAPLAEEIIFRGFLYSSLKKAVHTIPAIILTSLLFCLGHLFEGGSGGLLWSAMPQIFLLSLTAIYLREKTGRLWSGVTVHAINNGIGYFALFLWPLIHK